MLPNGTKRSAISCVGRRGDSMTRENDLALIRNHFIRGSGCVSTRDKDGKLVSNISQINKRYRHHFT